MQDKFSCTHSWGLIGTPEKPKAVETHAHDLSNTNERRPAEWVLFG